MMRYLVLGGLGLFVLAAAGFGVWMLGLPGPAAVAPPPPLAQGETAAMLAALQPPKRRRPLIAVIGINDATETTDYLMPPGILRRADIADVVLLATGPGPVRLFPALSVEADATIADFDARHAEGADYVIVPAMSRDDDPAVMAWLRAQAAKGAIVIGICAGAKVVASAGLLDGRRATTHWYYLGGMLAQHPAITYVADRRMVVDGAVATTTGITASLPMMLILIEAVAGRAKAEAVAADLGLEAWDARHASAAFTLTRSFVATVLGNLMVFRHRERFGIELRPGIDEVSLALVADAWSRTYRSRAASIADATGAIETRNGIRVIADARPPADPGLSLPPGEKPAQALDRTLRAIAERYGEGTADVVAMQLEYPR